MKIATTPHAASLTPYLIGLEESLPPHTIRAELLVWAGLLERSRERQLAYFIHQWVKRRHPVHASGSA